MAAETNSLINTAIDQSITELDKLLDEARKYLLQNDMFMRHMTLFQQGAAQIISIMSAPAIRIYDNQGGVHFMVSGERWKLFMAAQFFYQVDGNEGCKEFNCTNPINYTYDHFIITKANAIRALNDYEEVYDQNIKIVMEINDVVAGLANVPSNGEKLDALREVVNLLRKGIKNNRDFYEVSLKGN